MNWREAGLQISHPLKWGRSHGLHKVVLRVVSLRTFGLDPLKCGRRSHGLHKVVLHVVSLRTFGHSN